MVPKQQCAFVCFTNRYSAETAAEMSFNKLILKGRRLKILWGKSQGAKAAPGKEGGATLAPVPGLPEGGLRLCRSLHDMYLFFQTLFKCCSILSALPPPPPSSKPDENNFFNLPSTPHPPISGIPLPPPAMSGPPRPLMGGPSMHGQPPPGLMPPRLPPPPGQRGQYPPDQRGPYPPPHRFMPPPPFLRGPPTNMPPPNVPPPQMSHGPPPNRGMAPIHDPSQDPLRMGTGGKDPALAPPPTTVAPTA